MNVFVTGATGYAGLHAAAALRNAGHTVYGLVRNATSKRAVLLQQQEIALVVGDLKTPESYLEALAQSDAIVHTVLDHADPVGTDNAFFETLKALAISHPTPTPRRFVYTTGCSIYGKVPERVMDETTPGNPAHALYFRMEQEKVVLALPSDAYSTVVVRPGFMYGMDTVSTIYGGWFQAGANGNPVYYGDTEKGWSWVHIKDLADAYVKIVEKDSSISGEIFCLADEKQPLCLDVFKACIRVAGYTGEIITAPSAANDWNAVFDQNEFITSRKAHKILGWMPKHIGILENIDTYYASWKANQ
jgi:nucleoside-diphosphate-sugar epimerase